MTDDMGLIELGSVREETFGTPVGTGDSLVGPYQLPGG
jgi:hypothetical protein